VIAAFALCSAFRFLEFRRAHALDILEQVGPALIRALLAPAIAVVIAIWIVSWQGIPYLVSAGRILDPRC
jgi:hypothetical protein